MGKTRMNKNQGHNFRSEQFRREHIRNSLGLREFRSQILLTRMRNSLKFA